MKKMKAASARPRPPPPIRALSEVYLLHNTYAM